jgi:hypothetical protein
MGERRGVYRILVENLRERDQWGDQGIDSKILTWIFRKWDVGRVLDRAGSGRGQVAGTFKCGNEHSSSIKCGEFLE